MFSFFKKIKIWFKKLNCNHQFEWIKNKKICQKCNINVGTIGEIIDRLSEDEL